MNGGVIGRDDELRSTGEFLEGLEAGPAALVFSGEPGIGKTILWEAALEEAARRQARVLSCRCLETEAAFSFGGLSDLVTPVLDEVGHAVAPPRRRALEVALLLAEPGSRPLSPRAIGLAFLDVVRSLSEQDTVVVAVDDLQWLDASSSVVLQIALRRLGRERVGFLATLREAPGSRIPFEAGRWFPEERLGRISLRPLSLAALHHLLRDRLGLDLRRPQLVRLRQVTGGNPLYALELGRDLALDGERVTPRKPFPLPAGLAGLLEQRLERLPAETADVLLAVAALARPTAEAVAGIHPEPQRALDALEAAAREGVVALDGSRVSFAHPLFASVCYERAPSWRRRETHRLLAAVVDDEEERVRHLALAADATDAGVADDLESAAVAAEARGAIAAADLLDLAAQLTPLEDGAERRRRRWQAAWEHQHAGDPGHAAAIMEQLLAEVPSGAERSDALFQLAVVRRPQELPAILACFEDALVEAADDDRRAARILATRSGYRLRHDPRGALADARAGLEKAERLEQKPIPQRLLRYEMLAPAWLLAWAIARLARVETRTLDITPGLLERGMALEAQLTVGSNLTFSNSSTAAYAHRLIFRDDPDRARAILEGKLAELTSEPLRASAELDLLVLEWLCGNWRQALDHAAEARELAEQVDEDLLLARVLQCAAQLDLDLGRSEEARAEAERALGISRALSDEITAIESLAVLGQLELVLGNVQRAVQLLDELPSRLVSLGWNDPSSPVWADTIEALIAVRETTRARACLEQFEERARRANRLSVCRVTRCRGLLAATEGDFPAAFAAFDDALAGLASLPYPFERGRTLLSLGQVRRQARQKRASRAALEDALAVFERLGARLWAEKAGSELRRISGRRPGAHQLTETEERVASLAASGLANKEIAASLFMSVHTVEAHLTRVYRKLGIKSRTALAHKLALAEGDGSKE
jgi:DNA-binding CsgD family transcriptional regulator